MEISCEWQQADSLWGQMVYPFAFFAALIVRYQDLVAVMGQRSPLSTIP